MRITLLVKQLNNTELGKGGTHDTYVLIPNELDVTDIFEAVDKPITFMDLETNQTVTVRNTVGREKRIVGLGQYYRSKNLSAGDEIIFEKRSFDNRTENIVRVFRHPEMIAFQNSKNGFEILTPDRMGLAESWKKQLDGQFEIRFLETAKKRGDSPDTTDYYDIIVDGNSIRNQFTGKEIGVIGMKENKIEVTNFYGWKKYNFVMED